MSVEDRQKKMRYILSINGIKGASYWFGMFLADYILFLLPTLLFVIFILIIQLSGFEQALPKFLCITLGFGLGIVPLTYFISSFFDNQDSAIKFNIRIQLIFGVIVPELVIGILAAVQSSSFIVEITLTFFYVVNPMFTFYIANYELILNYMISLYIDIKPVVIPLAFGLNASFSISLACFVIQFILYMGLVIMMD